MVRFGLTIGALFLAMQGHAQGAWTFEGNTTPTWEEAIEEFRELAEAHTGATLKVIGADDNGRPIHLFVLHDGSGADPDSLRADGKRILWITNAIHAGEPDGVDASLLLARALLHSDQYMGLLARTAVCIVPVLNVSGALQRNAHTRANQNGPEEYGFRANDLNLDLNRDFIKADSRNIRALLQALASWDPDIYFETHVSNGADHQYVMELLTSHPDRLEAPLRSFLQAQLKPGLYAWMGRRSLLMCPYFETRGDHPEQGLEGFLDGPRYSTGHAGLRQRIGILSETHMLKPYADRMNATFQLQLAALAVMDQHGEELARARADARRAVSEASGFGTNHRLDTTQVEELPWKGYAARYKPSAVSGAPRLFYDREHPTDTMVPWMDHFIPALELVKPKAYLVPQAWQRVIQRLQWEGVPMQLVRERTPLTVEVQHIADFRTTPEPYEGHYLHSGTSTTTERGSAEARPGDMLVPMGHATDRLVMEVLEPRTNDSFFAWGFFDSILQRKEWFSSYVFEDMAAELLEHDPRLRKELEQHRAEDPTFAADPWQQLYWVYQRSPNAEPGFRRYPVLRVVD